MPIPDRRVTGITKTDLKKTQDDFISVKESSEFISKKKVSAKDAANNINRKTNDFFKNNGKIDGENVLKKLGVASSESGATKDKTASEKSEFLGIVASKLKAKVGPFGSSLTNKKKIRSLSDLCDLKINLDLGIDFAIIAAFANTDICDDNPVSNTVYKFGGKIGGPRIEKSLPDLLHSATHNNAKGMLQDTVDNSETLKLSKYDPAPGNTIGNLITMSELEKESKAEDAYNLTTDSMKYADDKWLGESNDPDITQTSKNESIGEIGDRRVLSRVPNDPSVGGSQTIQVAEEPDDADFMAAGKPFSEWIKDDPDLDKRTFSTEGVDDGEGIDDGSDDYLYN